LTSLDHLPVVLTIEEAADVLRISKWAAYEQARMWRESGGRAGLPVVTFGRCLRVPRWALERILRLEPVDGDSGDPDPGLRVAR
jgi:hypothetical protein